MPKSLQKLTPEALISATQAAAIVGVSLTWISRLVREGYISPSAPRRYRLIDVVQGYLRFLTDESRRTAQSKPDADLRAARKREIELRVAERESRLIDAEDAEAGAAFIIEVLRESSAGIGQHATRDRALSAKIDQTITAAIDRAERRFAEAFAALRAGRDPLDMSANHDV